MGQFIRIAKCERREKVRENNTTKNFLKNQGLAYSVLKILIKQCLVLTLASTNIYYLCMASVTKLGLNEEF